MPALSERRLAQIEKMYSELPGETEEQYLARMGRNEKEVRDKFARNQKRSSSPSTTVLTYEEFVAAMASPKTRAELDRMSLDERHAYTVEQWRLNREKSRLWDEKVALRNAKDNGVMAIRMRHASTEALREYLEIHLEYNKLEDLPRYIREIEQRLKDSDKEVLVEEDPAPVMWNPPWETRLSLQRESSSIETTTKYGERYSKLSHARLFGNSWTHFESLARRRHGQIVPKHAVRHSKFRLDAAGGIFSFRTLGNSRSNENWRHAVRGGDRKARKGVGGDGLKAHSPTETLPSPSWTPPPSRQVRPSGKCTNGKESARENKEQRESETRDCGTPYNARTRVYAHKSAKSGPTTEPSPTLQEPLPTASPPHPEPIGIDIDKLLLGCTSMAINEPIRRVSKDVRDALACGLYRCARALGWPPDDDRTLSCFVAMMQRTIGQYGKGYPVQLDDLYGWVLAATVEPSDRVAAERCFCRKDLLLEVVR